LSNKPYDTKSDIFASGVILYLLLTGCTPFFGENTSEIVEKNQNANVCYDFKEIGIRTSPEALDLLKKML
jgi:calcium-dependent protein kinase